jgi:hypothetical protein
VGLPETLRLQPGESHRVDARCLRKCLFPAAPTSEARDARKHADFVNE